MKLWRSTVDADLQGVQAGAGLVLAMGSHTLEREALCPNRQIPVGLCCSPSPLLLCSLNSVVTLPEQSMAP